MTDKKIVKGNFIAKGIKANIAINEPASDSIVSNIPSM